ncbi:hypothetical protein [Fusobacterium sp.]|uniref:hypothetical protein n=1 Tax=Fusobacterium sp. TaxID=68766 RepID=UPI00262E79D4|nr:hypothetical protein [Fusobacterium sp.]
MKAVDKWRELKEETKKEISAENKTVQDIKNILVQKIENIQHNVMSEEKNSKLRQQIGILFTILKENFNIYNTLGSVRIWSEENIKVYKQKGNIVFLTLMHCVLFYSLWYSFSQGIKLNYYTMISVGIAGLVSEILILLLILKKYREDSKIVETVQKTEINLNIDKIMEFMDRNIEALDRYIEELTILNGLENKKESNLDKNILEVFQKFDEIEKTDNKVIVPMVNKEIENILLSNNIEKIEYSKETEKYFDILPSKNSTMTIKSAFIEKDSNKVFVRGVAIKKIN